MNEPRRQSGYGRLTDYLESMIASGGYKTGDRLPPLRRLAEEFGISLDAARRGVWRLRDKGLLVCRRGDGVFVNGHRPAERRSEKIALMFKTARPFTTYIGHVVQGVQEEAQRLGVVLEIRPVNSLGASLDTSDFDSDCKGLLLLGNFDAQAADIRCVFPVVGVEMHRTYDGLVSTVSLDPWRAAELAALFFSSRGVRKVEAWSHRTPLHEFRVRCFRSQWTAAGGEVDVRYAEQCAAAPHGDPDVGYFFSGGSCANEIAADYRDRTGRALAEDFAAVSLDGKSLLVPDFEPMNTIFPEWREAGKIALNELLRRIRTPGASSLRIYCDVKFRNCRTGSGSGRGES